MQPQKTREISFSYKSQHTGPWADGTVRQRHTTLRALLVVLLILVSSFGGALEGKQIISAVESIAHLVSPLVTKKASGLYDYLLLQGAISGGSATTYYLGPAGSDGANCLSTGTACATLGHVSSLVAPGDTIQFAAGTYGAQTATMAGSAGLPITVQPAPSALVTFTLSASPSDQAQQTPLLILTDTAYVDWEGAGRMTLVGMKGRGDATLSDHVAGSLFKMANPIVTGSSLTIAGTAILHANGTCLLAANEQITLRDDYLADCGQAANAADVGISAAASGVLIATTYVSDTTTSGIVLSGASAVGGAAPDQVLTSTVVWAATDNGSSNTTSPSLGDGIAITGTGALFQRNIVSGAQRSGILLNGSSNTADYNEISNSGLQSDSHGILVVSGTGNRVLNNTEYFDSYFGDISVGGASGTPASTVVENNTVDNWGAAAAGLVASGGATGTVADYNLFASPGSHFPTGGLLGAHSVTQTANLDHSKVGNGAQGGQRLGITGAGAFVGWSNLHDRSALGVAGDASVALLPFNGAAPDVGAYPFNAAPTVTATYYIAPTGTDDGPCTAIWPCATLGRAAALTGPGDVVQASSGTYYTGSHSGADQTINTVGTAAYPVLLQAVAPVTVTRPYSNGTPSAPGNPAGATPYVGNEATEQAQLLNYQNAGYITTTGFTLVGMKNRPDSPVAQAVTGATNANPIVIATGSPHHLNTGDIILISGVLGNTNANGSHTVTFVDATHFSIGVAGNGAYTSGGSIAVKGPLNGEVNIQLSGGLSHVTLLSDTITGPYNTCVKDQNGSDSISLLNSTLLSCGLDSLDHGFYGDGNNLFLSGNVISGTTGFGIHIHGGSPQNFLVQGNTVRGSYYSQIFNDAGNGTVDGNTVIDTNGSGTIAPINVLGAVTVTRNIVDNVTPLASQPRSNYGNCIHLVDPINDLVAHNSCWNSGPGAISLGFNGFVDASNGLENTYPITVEDNIFANSSSQDSPYFNYSGGTSSGSIVVPAVNPALIHDDYNIYRNYTAGSGNDAVTLLSHDLTSDPLFVSAPTTPPSDLHLQGGSPAIGSGVVLPGVSFATDPPDRGALFFGVASTPTPTSTPTVTPPPTVTPTFTPAPTNTPTITPTPIYTALPSSGGQGHGGGTVHTGHRH